MKIDEFDLFSLFVIDLVVKGSISVKKIEKKK